MPRCGALVHTKAAIGEGEVQNAALRWENVGGTGWEGSNAHRDGQTGESDLGHSSDMGWGSAVAVLAGCEKCVISSLQHCPRLDVPPKETAGSTFMPQCAKTRELKCDEVNSLETVVCEKKEKNGSCFT